MRFWLSWYQPTEDYRPLKDPPNEAVLRWWCTGRSEQGATLCAVVQATTKRKAKAAIRKDWPEAKTWRFCDAISKDFRLSDRFPVSGYF